MPVIPKSTVLGREFFALTPEFLNLSSVDTLLFYILCVNGILNTMEKIRVHIFKVMNLTIFKRKNRCIVLDKNACELK